jgi:hypothetical protein
MNRGFTLTPAQLRALDTVIPKECWATVSAIKVLGPRLPNLPFEEARAVARAHNYPTAKSYRASRPNHLPINPDMFYKGQFVSWGDWLGHAVLTKGPYRPFEGARSFARSLGLKSKKEWASWISQRPLDIPATPQHIYKQVWKGWGDFLGTGNIQGRNKWISFKTCEDAKTYGRNLGLKNHDAWLVWRKSTERPSDIPSNPNRTYPEWQGVRDWLGLSE